MERNSTHKKTALLFTFLIIHTICIFSDRGNSVSYTISYKIASDSLDIQSVVDDFYDFLNSFYAVKKEFSRIETSKYDWKKFNRYENVFIIYEQNMYLLIKANIEQFQPYLFYKEQNADYYMQVIFSNYGRVADRHDYAVFEEEVDEKVRKYAEEHNGKSVTW